MAIADEVDAPSNLAGYDPHRSCEGYWFDGDAAAMAVRFVEKYCCHVKGALAGRPLLLSDWQQDIVRTIFGWKSEATGFRRYRTAYVEVPRKNGKSTMAAGIALRQLIGDGEQGGEVYSAAGTQDQAAIVFNVAASMVRRSQALTSKVKILDSRKRMTRKATDSFYRAVAAEGGLIHGTNPSTVIFDEIHNQPNRLLWDAFTSGFGSREQPLMMAITTAGHDRNSICWDQHTYAERVRDGVFHDPTFLPVLYNAREKDDWENEDVWYKANPNLGISVSLDYLRNQYRRAKESPTEENSFRQWHLNQWTQQQVRAIPMAAWHACQAPIDWETFRGKPCYAGLDLASTRDLCAFSRAWMLEDGGVAIRVKFFISGENAKAIERKRNVPYTKWARDGWITITHSEGGVDYQAIEREIAAAHAETPILELAYDRWNANQTITGLTDNQRILCVAMGQGKASMSTPCKFFVDSVIDGELIHDGNETMGWHVDNLEVKTDDQENMTPAKGGKQEFNKIDGCVATMMALARLMLHRNKASVYERRGIVEIEW